VRNWLPAQSARLPDESQAPVNGAVDQAAPGGQSKKKPGRSRHPNKVERPIAMAKPHSKESEAPQFQGADPDT